MLEWIHTESSSVQSPVRSDSLRTHGLQQARLPCPSPTPRANSNACPLSWWCHPTISSSVVPFSSCLQSFPASESLPLSQFFSSSHQVAKVLELQLQHQSFQWLISFRIDCFDLLAAQGTLKSLSNTTVKSINSSALSFFYCPTLISIYDYWKNRSFD